MCLSLNPSELVDCNEGWILVVHISLQTQTFECVGSCSGFADAKGKEKLSFYANAM